MAKTAQSEMEKDFCLLLRALLKQAPHASHTVTKCKFYSILLVMDVE